MSDRTNFPSHHVPNQWVAVVNDLNYFIRWASRTETHQRYLPHRSIQAMVFTSDHQLVVQKRHSQKMTYANHWDLSSSGHIERVDYLPLDLERLNQEWLVSQNIDPSIVFSSVSNQAQNDLYRRVALKEIYEELGVRCETIEFIDSFAPQRGIHYEHFHLFRVHSDGPFIPQESEVADIKTISHRQWDSFIQSHPCTESLKMLGSLAIDKHWWPTP